MKCITLLSIAFVLCNEYGLGQSLLKKIFSKESRYIDIKKDADLDVMDVIRSAGYPAETHNAETDDGYILTMHRIPYAKDSPTQSSTRSVPVLLQHGFLGSSVDFFLNPTMDALPFFLSDLGFDVWLGNVRGSTYSRKHTIFQPDSNEFWNYTWHEAGIYDTPATIDYILSTTDSEKLAYIGYSMGSTMFLVLTSMKPEYNDKIEAALLMAPIAFSSNVRSPLLRFLAPASRFNSVMRNLLATGEFISGHFILQFFRRYFCSVTLIDEMFCRKYIFLIFGTDYNHYSPSTITTLVNHYPAGSSARALIHFAQLIKSGKFQAYDYGKNKNYAYYGQAYPPNYDLTKITVPTYFYASYNDYLAPPEDVNHTATYLPNLRDLHIIEDPEFSHLDFLVGTDVSNFVYKPLLADLLQELNDSPQTFIS